MNVLERDEEESEPLLSSLLPQPAEVSLVATEDIKIRQAGVRRLVLGRTPENICTIRFQGFFILKLYNNV